MKFKFEIEIEVDRVQGKFASREDIVEQIEGWLEGANEGEVSGVGADGESEYEVVDYSVSEVPAA
jgi:hypothetical protein